MSKCARRERFNWLLRLLMAVVLALVGLGVPALSAEADSGKPDASASSLAGPALTVPSNSLRSALSCTGDLRRSSMEPVLMIPGTASTPNLTFGWNFLPAFNAQHIPHCTLTLPHNADGDIQVNAEYIVSAIRSMHAESGRKIQLLGWSQGGGPPPRWALRWWPDTRTMVDGLIGIDPPNHGTATLDAFGCDLTDLLCAPAIWQQRPGSNFIKALNDGPQVFKGIQYTVLYSRVNDFIQPSLDGSAAKLPSGSNVANIALQDVCPTAVVTSPDHAMTVGSPVTYALVMDALTHPGKPADHRRVSPSVCAQLSQPYSNPVTATLGVANDYANAFAVDLPQDRVSAEPPVREYARGK